MEEGMAPGLNQCMDTVVGPSGFQRLVVGRAPSSECDAIGPALHGLGVNMDVQIIARGHGPAGRRT
ncbi:hypothetical protein BX600DRAFT_446287 [Xylariales sp. PMI_506]|nr:hypothetical protein BX600DRAFT_446287 [Xylariales sp. PMI_506]